jgi:site-specific DNA recombinase
MRKVGIYCRVSTDEQAKNKEGSIKSQVQRLKLKIEEKNRYENNKWGKLVGIYKDEAYSGKNTDRPQYQKLLDDVRRNKIDTVIVTELSRLSRSVTDFLNFVQELEDLGADFICLQYDFDTTSPAGKVFMTIIMALAQFERELTAERIKNNFHARALRGLLNGGTPILGFDKHPTQSGSLVINKDEARIVKKMYQVFLESGQISEVLKYLKSKNIKNKAWTSKTGNNYGGKAFTHSTVYRLLTNPFYMGKREVNKENKELDQSTLKTTEKYHFVDASWEKIINEADFKKASKILEANKAVKHTATHDFILSGLLTCDECGQPLFGQSATGKTNKHYYYGHSKKSECKVKRYPAIELEQRIKKHLFSILNNQALKDDFISILKELSTNSAPEYKGELKAKKREEKLIQGQINKLIDVIASTDMAGSVDAIVKRLKDSEKELQNIQEQIAELEIKASNEEPQSINPDFVIENLKQLSSERFRKFKLQKKRLIAKSVIKSINISPDNLIQINVWTQENKNKDQRNTGDEKGVILPFLKAGRTLGVANASGGGRSEKKAKKNAEIETLVTEGSSSIAVGGGGENRTLLKKTEYKKPTIV